MLYISIYYIVYIYYISIYNIMLYINYIFFTHIGNKNAYFTLVFLLIKSNYHIRRITMCYKQLCLQKCLLWKFTEKNDYRVEEGLFIYSSALQVYFLWNRSGRKIYSVRPFYINLKRETKRLNSMYIYVHITFYAYNPTVAYNQGP